MENTYTYRITGEDGNTLFETADRLDALRRMWDLSAREYGIALETWISADAANVLVNSRRRVYWYAVLQDDEDNDLGTGSFDLDEATAKARDMREGGWPDAHIAVVESGPDPEVVDLIRDID